jgi:hypothetical protein
VQREKVANPPFTISDSVGVNSRAPRRISTLFWPFMFFSFRHLSPLSGPKAFQQKPFRLQGEDEQKCGAARRHPVQQIGPHSPMDASPSLLGQAVLGTVQRVSVCSPPPTRSISSSLSERAPLRTNTLFWSSMLFLLSSFLGPFVGPKSCQKGFYRPFGKAAR